MSDPLTACRFLIRGLVQGVGFRHFTYDAANKLGIRGYARNLADGSVEVYAVGTDGQLSELAGILRTGPRYSDVRSVERQEASVERYSDFDIR